MPSAKPQPPQAYPNNLQVARKAIRITQWELVARCEDLALNDPEQFSTVAISTVRVLERGKRKPQRRKALTLAAALGFGTDFEKLFPLGCEDPNHNSKGITRIPEDRPKGGRPPQK